ncbi:3-oxoacyl-[acyl-carrier protein] reductase/7-alpha-hydroxysteroid dehydrogenase [Novosphingobium sp. CF614]|uniref:SDR family NAD(P)-dependent oxidoreductase n=1 Tax=Novosphingobium sp. CF614 TaxID=1884364 RepID=UPI0008E90325|nr:SDR family oxidoreductase [Novosphingobium sp. CF614]SFF82833.1 3-oxoacyl-[acyl-carrier protein] reductase/7-alpha-hydroxysteroid dehydrogenase [Novosphingobium sp. CF614]
MNEIFSLEGKVALVTGSSRGIGKGIARMFAKAGAAVAITGRSASEVEATAAEIREAGGRAVGLPVDIGDAAQLPGLIDAIVAEFGGLDILVNNAGGGTSSAFVDTTIEELEGHFHLLVSISFELARLALPQLLARPGASIINILSPGSYKATRGNLSYYVAKSALQHLTKLMAADLGPRVRVNAIIPGPIETPALQRVFAARPEILGVAVNSTRLKRIGKPDEIGYGAVYLASEAASFVTGAILPIHGGDVEELRQISPDL